MNHRLTITAALASAAASTGLFPLIIGGGWFWGGVGAIIVVAGIGTLTRLRVLPPVVCLLAALGALLLYLNLVYEARLSFLHLFPSGASLAGLWRLFLLGLNETQRYASPVPPLRGIVLLATAGVGLVAALTDLIAVRLRRSALAGLPLLVLFSVPVASGAGKNTLGDAIVFCIGMAGYLALLSADGRERLRLWGRLVTPWTPAPDEPAEELGSGPSTRALAASGRRIGLAAVALALFVPVLVPSLHAHKIFPSNHHGPGPGPGTGHGGTSLRPLVQMNHQLQESKPSVVLTYNTTDSHPQYLQMFVLGNLTDNSWTMSLPAKPDHIAGTAPLPEVPGRPAGRWPTATTTIQVKGNALGGDDFLPAPYAPRELHIPGSWDTDPGTLMLYSGSQSLDGLNYTVTSVDVNPLQLDPGPLPAGAMKQYLSVPKTYRSLRPLAKKIVRGAARPRRAGRCAGRLLPGQGQLHLQPDPPARAPRCQRRQVLPRHDQAGVLPAVRVRDGRARPAARHPVTRRRGLHGRDEDQPGTCEDRRRKLRGQDQRRARVARAVLPGAGLAADGADAVRQRDRPGHGDPALLLGGSVVGGGVSKFSQTSQLNDGQLKRQKGHETQPDGLGHKGGFAEGGLGSQKARTAHSGPPVLLFVLAALLVIGLITPRATRSLIRRRRWLTARTDAARAHAAWSELLDDLTDHGIRHAPGETPRTVEKTVARRLRLTEPDREALLRITQAEERASYAKEPGPSGTLPADVAAMRGAISASVTRGSRWQARLLPSSAVERTRQALSHATRPVRLAGGGHRTSAPPAGPGAGHVGTWQAGHVLRAELTGG